MILMKMILDSDARYDAHAAVFVQESRANNGAVGALLAARAAAGSCDEGAARLRCGITLPTTGRPKL
jgi:hypothetical protein